MAQTTKEIKALERLTSKLSALRKTLRGEERQLLDAMVLDVRSEVSTHAAAVKPSPASTSGVTAQKSEVAMHAASLRGAKAKTKNMAVSEVAIHAAKVSPAVTSTKNMAVSEVAMHTANVRGVTAAAKDLAVADTKSARVVLDAKTGVYGVVVD